MLSPCSFKPFAQYTCIFFQNPFHTWACFMAVYVVCLFVVITFILQQIANNVCSCCCNNHLFVSRQVHRTYQKLADRNQ